MRNEESQTINRNDPNLRTLSGLVRTFMQHPTPRTIFIGAACAWSIRLYLGRWGIRDTLSVAMLTTIFQPLQEALAHRYLLHAPSFNIGPWQIDIGKFHRLHHEHPERLDGFVPTAALLIAPPLALASSYLLAREWPLTCTLFATWITLGLNYEWTHFAVHAPYQPKTWWGRFNRRNHMLHHNKNEHFWWVVSIPSPLDRILFWFQGYGYWRAPKDIPHSSTVRTVF